MCRSHIIRLTFLRQWMMLICIPLIVLVAAAGCSLNSSRVVKARVRLQLKWVRQAQFAGYYAAADKGFYDEQGLDISILPGGSSVAPEAVIAGGGAEFGIDWLASLLGARERGMPVVNIAQIFQYSGMREVAFKDSGIRTAADLRGRRVSVWFGGNEFALLATLEKYQIDRHKDITLVEQRLDMNLFLNREVDAAAAMTYNEYRMLLDSGVRPEDLVVIDFNAEGTAMMEDGIFAREDWLKDPRNREIAVRFLRASLRGWEYCRDNPADCVAIVLKQTPALSKEHQSWMLTEVNKLIWGPPTPGVELGYMDPEAFKRTVDIAFRFAILKKPADESAYTHEIWEMARKTR